MNLKRKIKLFLSKDGVFNFARTRTKKYRRLLGDGCLPCASVNTLKEAEDMQVATCKLSYNGLFYRYPLVREEGLDGLKAAGERIEALYLYWQRGGKGWPLEPQNAFPAESAQEDKL